MHSDLWLEEVEVLCKEKGCHLLSAKSLINRIL